MAIKVNGTTVIDNSRNFTNIAGGFKTVNGTSVVGSGDISAGASTTAGAVGTYIWGRPQNITDYSPGDTATSLYPVSSASGGVPYVNGANTFTNAHVGPVRSGTWRCMSDARGGGDGFMGLWVRIS